MLIIVGITVALLTVEQPILRTISLLTNDKNTVQKPRFIDDISEDK
ncbi:hypothetical protein [Thalassotalea hakodatensis]|nr:hypothetical protein [Thalassotalea hakodatensis]